VSVISQRDSIAGQQCTAAERACGCGKRRHFQGTDKCSSTEQQVVVLQVGPGVKDLAEGDVVLPVVPLLGCWAEAAVVKAKSVVRVGKLAAGSAASSAAPDAAAAQPGELRMPVMCLR
jgi:hypothetical protein